MESDFSTEIGLDGNDVVILRKIDDLTGNLVANSRVEPHQSPFFHHVHLHPIIIPNYEGHQAGGGVIWRTFSTLVLFRVTVLRENAAF